ncbi:FAD/NAD(P)-binding domain-containing protein [Lentithecium fluviatile CBS 122367]|uniref:FAD/NAD(P)-binding domain-containing protein n=1 Tax=Lentithecium fluviatile CBS 122367 TaxID=1168545 RepID=A0A6G1J6I8_9PLEO|nr:FAD/NAD(P)-binding domain-containing protein [Lentithecium fluviatile CBS 122367]
MPVVTEVLIVGAGTSGLMSAARPKALGAESVILDRNAQVDDSWTIRYENLELHEPQNPHLLTKDEIAEHLLNMIVSANIQCSIYSPSEEKWTVRFKTAGGGETRTIVSKHFIHATGLGGVKPYIPSIENDPLYQGTNIHSTQFHNEKNLAELGIKTVTVIGSANTAFDVIEDCDNAGLKTTMVARSPTYVFPYDYIINPNGIGVYEAMPPDAADTLLLTLPCGVDGQFSHALFAHLAPQEPGQYEALGKAGIPVIDSMNPDVNLQHNMIERGGGHYIDLGTTESIVDGKVAVSGNVEPVSYTETGLRLSDGSVIDSDAIIWCTGFADKNVREVAKEALGADEIGPNGADLVLGPTDIAARLDATWGMAAEGEVRGVLKRHLRMENYWVNAGAIMLQRWWSGRSPSRSS